MCWSAPLRTTQYVTLARGAGRAHIVRGGSSVTPAGHPLEHPPLPLPAPAPGPQGSSVCSRPGLQGSTLLYGLRRQSACAPEGTLLHPRTPCTRVNASFACATTDHCYLECSNWAEAADPAGQPHRPRYEPAVEGGVLHAATPTPTARCFTATYVYARRISFFVAMATE